MAPPSGNPATDTVGHALTGVRLEHGVPHFWGRSLRAVVQAAGGALKLRYALRGEQSFLSAERGDPSGLASGGAGAADDGKF